MRINYHSPAKRIAPLPSVNAIHIRAHRDNATHRAIIGTYRASHPLCERCLHIGHTTPAHQIHHMRPVADGGPTSDENLLSLCKSCHDSIHTLPLTEQMSFKEQIQPVTVSGCDQKNLNIDTKTNYSTKRNGDTPKNVGR